ncbi:MAG: hypothetical protein ACFFC7_13130 [Candidatus Hermodarchaeota archaeon]
MRKKTFFLKVSVIIILLLGATVVAAQPTPETAHWACNVGDIYSWTITKLRINDAIDPYDVGPIITGVSNLQINGTEGDTIEITILSLGDANTSIPYIEVNIKIGENKLVPGISLPSIFILPIYNREYWDDFMEYQESQYMGPNCTIEGDLLTCQWSTPNATQSFTIDIAKGYYKKLERSGSGFGSPPSNETLELQIDFLSIAPLMCTGCPGFESLGVVLGLALIAIVPVIICHRRK